MSDAEFEDYCAKERVRQRGLGCCVPEADHQADYHLWRRTARAFFDRQQRETASKGARHKAPPPSDGSANKQTRAEDPLVREMAERLEHHLDNQFFASALTGAGDTPPEEFPMPTQGEDMRGLLATLEVSLRLGLTCADNQAVRQVALSGIQNHVTLMNKGIVAFQRGKYPSVFLLLNLLSLSAVFQKWPKTDAGTRKKVLESAAAICNHIRSPQSEALQATFHSVTDAQDAALLLPRIGELVTCIPYDFPTVCRPALCAVQPDAYREPAGSLVLGPPAPPAKRQRAVEEDVCVGEIVSHPTAPRQPASKPAGEYPCGSKYHPRYANKKATASKSCCFCSTCHLLEVLFNGVTTNCSWNHWPTRTKVGFHLKLFPEAKELALKQLALLERGIPLKRFDTIPL
ncbi:hypothetical protein STCU_07904 [Strigomonas culicis]|uniref:Uncharacterized protein n=1 Tax=Strigomonas culicis TaxID=28005 RepID=S9U2P2_9TRYP|nr:hypothetical protein STCU_07904 [Strigomonas culicis]|eukprot:EPY23054.1 hypothetical protein STCU_07904 [Strigomonas culicis]